MESKSSKIEIAKEDIMPHIYFVCSLAQEGRMYGGISGKSDYIGGIFDRWVNTIPESIIFNKHFLPKLFPDNQAEVISDYFRYNPKKAGIAPDVIGIRIDESEVVNFTVFDNKWRMIDGAPKIEVKSFKKEQYMVTLRDQGYDDYLVMVETDLSSDYLLPFFNDSVFQESVYAQLKMSEDLFIINNDDDHLTQIKRINHAEKSLGSLRLITVCKSVSFKKYSNYCGPRESPVYINEIRDARINLENKLEQSKPLDCFLKINEQTKLYAWKTECFEPSPNERNIYLDITVENIDNIRYIHNSKSSITIYAIGTAKINNQLLSKGGYIIKLASLDRSNKKTGEYFMHKTIVGNVPTEENRMLKHIRSFIDGNIS